MRLECFFYSTSSMDQNHCAEGDTDVAAEGRAVTPGRDTVLSDLKGREFGACSIFLQVLPKSSLKCYRNV